MEQQRPFSGIDTLIIRVSNIEQSGQWYQEKLGLGIIWDAPEMKLRVLDSGSPVSITLWETGEPIQPNPATTAYPIFSTADAAASRALLMERQVKTSELTDDGTVRYFFFYDPDGNVLEACQVLA